MSHSDDLHKTKVTIFGSEYVLSSEESEEYTSKISNFVNQKMHQIAETENTGDTTRIALMAAFDIADQIVRQRTRRRDAHVRVDEALGRLEQQIDDEKNEKRE
jgi:cell division protein ZapA (FtsZ GTPase activity inhibitor)